MSFLRRSTAGSGCSGRRQTPTNVWKSHVQGKTEEQLLSYYSEAATELTDESKVADSPFGHNNASHAASSLLGSNDADYATIFFDMDAPTASDEELSLRSIFTPKELHSPLPCLTQATPPN